jgi:hypothetical protein
MEASAERFALIVASEPPQPEKGEVHNQQRHYGDAGPIDPIENPECHGLTEARTNNLKQSPELTGSGISLVIPTDVHQLVPRAFNCHPNRRISTPWVGRRTPASAKRCVVAVRQRPASLITS